jgi:hypothetical protein
MADLPANPSLDHLRRQARDLLRPARAGDTTAADRIRAAADALTLASAQLAVAREGPGSGTRTPSALLFGSNNFISCRIFASLQANWLSARRAQIS